MTKTQFIIICVIVYVFGFFSSCILQYQKNKNDPEESIETPVTLKLKSEIDSIFRSIEIDRQDIQKFKEDQRSKLDSLKQNSKQSNEEKKQTYHFTPTSKSRWIDSLERANNLK